MLKINSTTALLSCWDEPFAGCAASFNSCFSSSLVESKQLAVILIRQGEKIQVHNLTPNAAAAADTGSGIADSQLTVLLCAITGVWQSLCQ